MLGIKGSLLRWDDMYLSLVGFAQRRGYGGRWTVDGGPGGYGGG